MTIIRNLWLGCLALLGAAAASCTDHTDEPYLSGGDKTTIQTRLAGFVSEGGISVLPGENEISDMRAYLFEDGLLRYVSGDLGAVGGSYSLDLPYRSGNLYMVANAGKAGILGDVSASSVNTLTEAEWLEKTVAMRDGQAPGFFTGSVALEHAAGGTPVSLTLKRGVARFDVLAPEDGVRVKRMTVKNISDKAYIFPQEEISTPEGAGTTDVSVDFPEPLAADKPGAMYVYEQSNDRLLVELEVEDAGGTKTLSAPLPAVLRRNAVYSLRVEKPEGHTELRLQVKEWEYADDTELRPGLGKKITISTSDSSLPDGSSVNGAGDVLTLGYLPSRTVLAVECDNDLEVTVQGDAAKVSAATDESGKPLRNKFVIEKDLTSIGIPVRTVTLQFRRKGMEYAYDEDRITVQLEKNPTTLEGPMDFANEEYAHDFGKYVDGELGTLILPEGKEPVIEFAGEDPWIEIVPVAGQAGKYRILGGWRPNDPKADGREQSATLVIRAKGETGSASSAAREAYTIKRRNFGMPVTRMNGVWWCKYNAMGNSRDFHDQILVPDDPAAKADKTLLEYLRDCTPEEYMKLWTSSSYEGGSGVALTAVAQGGKIQLEGYKGNLPNISLLDPKALAPDGYELPAVEHYDRIFGTWTRFDRLGQEYGPYNVYSPWEGNKETFSYSCARTDLSIGGTGLPSTLHVEIYNKKNGAKNESVVFYGPGSQWGGGGINHNKIIWGCYSPNEQGWFNPAGGYALRRQAMIGAYTRVLRFIKSPVEYIY